MEKEQDQHIYKRHNKSLLLYHIVCPAKYRRKVFTKAVSKTLKEVCKGIGERYEIHFIEVGMDEDHVHFLIQSVPMLSVHTIIQMIKSITAKVIFERHAEVKKQLWGGKVWTSGYYVNTVGQYGNADVILRYVQNQGRQYEKIYATQIKLFDDL